MRIGSTRNYFGTLSFGVFTLAVLVKLLNLRYSQSHPL